MQIIKIYFWGRILLRKQPIFTDRVTSSNVGQTSYSLFLEVVFNSVRVDFKHPWHFRDEAIASEISDMDGDLSLKKPLKSNCVSGCRFQKIPTDNICSIERKPNATFFILRPKQCFYFQELSRCYLNPPISF